MSNSDPRTWLDRTVGAALSLLVGATAVYAAVRLIEAVWAVLLVVSGIVTALAAAVVLIRARRGRW